MVDDKKLIIEPLSYIRGRSLVNTFFIIDEAQNMEAETLEELRMLSNINADKDQALQVATDALTADPNVNVIYGCHPPM